MAKLTVFSEMELDLLPALTPYLLIALAFFMPLLRFLSKGRLVARVLSLLGLIIAFVFSVLIVQATSKGSILFYALGGFPPPIGIVYTVDWFSSLLGLLVASLFLLLAPLSPVFVDDNEYYYSALLALEAGLLGVLYTGDIFNMFVMLEVFTIAAFVLISAARTREAFKATIIYAIVGMVAGTFFFFAAVLVYYVTGVLNIGQAAAIVSHILPPLGRSVDPGSSIVIPIFIVLWSMLVESAISPLHFWLPEAYSYAPPVISSILSGLAESMAFYVIARVYYTLYGGMPDYVMWLIGLLGGLTIAVATAGILTTEDLMKMLSYTVILDSGMIALALSQGSTGLAPMLAYAIAHAIVKPILFLSGGYIVSKTGSSRIKDLPGLMRSDWAVSLPFVIGVLNVIGIPPTLMFMAKLQLYQAALETFLAGNLASIITLVMVPVGSAAALIGFIKVLTPLFTQAPTLRVARPPTYLRIVLLVLSLTSIIAGFLYYFILPVIQGATGSLLARYNYIKTVLPKVARGV
ncbi:proton-conducting transporter transmembrane domain-containing protein [Thermogladius sp. 4427co]|uniref:proton-conducting transporter transmembrane domain-containing protein n=1 Tax=Thermogladius sp. 4427co TaxID=3450718 RepID=UPI003F7A228C